MTHETAALVEVDLDPAEYDVETLQGNLAQVEAELEIMTTDRNAADADCDKYVAFVNRLDRAVTFLYQAIVAANVAITDSEIAEIIGESLARSKVKEGFAAKEVARKKAVVELARAE